MKSATQHQLTLARRVLLYICHTKELTLISNGDLVIQFQVFVDSSYASHSDQKSQFGISIHLNHSSCSCMKYKYNYKYIKKAKLLARSSTEAEYLALFEDSKIIMWFRQSNWGFHLQIPQLFTKITNPPSVLFTMEMIKGERSIWIFDTITSMN